MEESKKEHAKPIRKMGGRTNLIGLFIMIFGSALALFGPVFFEAAYPSDKMEFLVRWGVYSVLIGGLVVAGLLKAEDIAALIKAKFGAKDVPKDEEPK